MRWVIAVEGTNGDINRDPFCQETYHHYGNTEGNHPTIDILNLNERPVNSATVAIVSESTSASDRLNMICSPSEWEGFNLAGDCSAYHPPIIWLTFTVKTPV